MAAQIQRESHIWDNDTYLKILLNFINQSMQSLPSPLFDRTKKFTGKDMDKLLPDQFRHIVGLIFQGKAPMDLEDALSATAVHRPKPMKSFCALFPGFNSATYDVHQMKLFVALRKLFPRDDDTLTPAVIINPAGDPMRTRKVLKYLTNMMIFIDQIELQFDELNEQMKKSCQEYDELVMRLDSLKMEINGRLVKLDDWKQEIPSLEAKSTQLSKEAFSLDEEVATLESEVQKLEKDFIQMKDHNRLIFQQNEMIKAEIAAKDNQIVTNGDVLMQEYKLESEKVKEMKKQRERFGEELKALQEKQSFFESINERVSSVIQFFKDVVQQMDDAAYVKSDCKQLEGEHQERLEAIREIQRKIDQLKSHDQVSIVKESNLKREKQLQWKDIRNQVSVWKQKLNAIVHDLEEMTSKSVEKCQVLEAKSQLAAELREKIIEDENYVIAIKANAEERSQSRILQVRDQLKEEFKDLL